jgi:hypothetical protein
MKKDPLTHAHTHLSEPLSPPCTQQALHRSLFPIEYEQDFYTSAVSEANG